MTMTRPDGRPIVVGVDPDPSRRAALAWAADEAARRRVPLRPVHVDSVPTTEFRRWDMPPSWSARDHALHDAGEHLLEAAVAFAEARQPQVEVAGLLAEGDPVEILREQGHDAMALVLGSRHPSRMTEVFGPTAITLPVMAHARCPVVVVPEPEHLPRRPEYVVVGVDGSVRSATAVAFAFEEAALRGAVLRALYVRQPGLLGGLDEDQARQEGRLLLSRTTAGRAEEYPDVELRLEVVSGHPPRILAEESAHAAALVVGTRGHGGLAGLLLGSVSQGVLRHAGCPVIAVPHTPGPVGGKGA
jgi:nucleotide-binding universal stress UspA family protein